MPEQPLTGRIEPARGSARPTLSVAMIACNEAENLRRTLPGLHFADEIVLVDSGSTDETLRVAAEHGVRVVQAAWAGFGTQKNLALDATQGEWILSLDADEAVSPELARQILAAIAAPGVEAYVVPRLNYFLGQPMRHGGLFPDPKLRLTRRGAARWREAAVHETMHVRSPGARTGRLQAPLHHYAYPSLAVYLEHLDRYSTLAAPGLAARGKTSRGVLAFCWHVVINPVATFVYNYVVRLGFLDGRRGLVYHLFHSTYVAQKYVKAFELGAARK